MNWTKPVAIGIGATAAAVGVGIATKEWFQPGSERRQEQQWDDRYSGKDRSATVYAGTGGAFPGMGALISVAGGVSLLARSSSVLGQIAGGVALIAAGAMAGASIASYNASVIGKNRSTEKWGVVIEPQAKQLLQEFDRNKDGSLSISENGTPEYLRKRVEPDPYTGTTKTQWDTIENFASASDIDKDDKIDLDEITAKLNTYDVNKNGKISESEQKQFLKDKNELLALNSTSTWYQDNHGDWHTY